MCLNYSYFLTFRHVIAKNTLNLNEKYLLKADKDSFATILDTTFNSILFLPERKNEND